MREEDARCLLARSIGSIRGGILNRKTNRTAFAVAVAVFDFQNLRLPQTAKYSRTDDEITLVLKQHNGVLQIHSPPTLEFVTLVVNLYFCECLKTCGFKPLIRGNRPHCGCGKPQNAVGLRFQKSPNCK
ncbi:unnamed protein product [Prunus armeniaca]